MLKMNQFKTSPTRHPSTGAGMSVERVFTPQEHEANLKKAASPMYYALKRILDSGESGHIPIEILQPAINAIAKAEGAMNLNWVYFLDDSAKPIKDHCGRIKVWLFDLKSDAHAFVDRNWNCNNSHFRKTPCFIERPWTDEAASAWHIVHHFKAPPAPGGAG